MNRGALLRHLATLVPPSPRVAEVGVLRGAFSRKILDALAPSVFLMVDPWKKFPAEEFGDYKNYTQVDWDRLYASVCSRFTVPGVQIIRAVSMEAVVQVPSGSLDFVYLDGNHEYSHVVDDLRAWSRTLRDGGILAGHDYDLPGVRAAVQEFRAGRPVATTTEASCVTYWWRQNS